MSSRTWQLGRCLRAPRKTSDVVRIDNDTRRRLPAGSSWPRRAKWSRWSNDVNGPARTHHWPSLLVDEWTATRDTLHMWTQIVGKIRMAHMPLINHWWQVTLY